MKIPSVSFRLLILLILIVTNLKIVYAQQNCNCNPEIQIIFDDCVSAGSETEIAYYVYFPKGQLSEGNAWIRLFQDDKIIVDKAVTGIKDGFWGEALAINPLKDSQLQLEFHCDKGKCFTSMTKILRVFEPYQIEATGISCNGLQDGSVNLTSSNNENMNIIWVDGTKKKSVTSLAKGVYPVTIESVNGCKVSDTIRIEEPDAIHAQAKYISVNSGGVKHKYIRMDVSGGKPDFLFEWQSEDGQNSGNQSYVECVGSNAFSCTITDQSGCNLVKEIAFDDTHALSFHPKDGVLYPESQLENGSFMFNLPKCLNPNHGDIDGDGTRGSIFDVKFLYDNQEIQEPKEFVTDANMDLTVVFEDHNGVKEYSKLQLNLGFFIIQNNSSTACDYFDPLEIVATTPSGDPLPAGGVFKVFERSSKIEYSDEVLDYDPVLNTWTWDPGYQPPSASTPLRYIIYYILGTDTLQSQLNVVSPSGSVDVLVDEVCGNGDLVQVLCSPKDGILDGLGLTSGFITFPNSDQILYFIDPKSLTPEAKYSYNYSIPQMTGSNGDLRCAATIVDSLDVFNFPSISIQQYKEEVCSHERMNLLSDASFTSGSSTDLNFQWFTYKNNVATEIPGATNSTIEIPGIEESTGFIVQVTQSNSCSAQDTGFVSVAKTPNISSDPIVGTTCQGTSNASGEITIEGVTDFTGYGILWEGATTGIRRLGHIQNNLPVDTFFITVTTPPLNADSLICNIYDTLVVKAFPSIDINCSPSDTTTNCFGDMNLVRTVTVSDDAVGPFGYSLVSKDGPFQSTNTFTGLGVGVDPSILEREYTVYVRDVYGCVDSCGFIIRQNSQLQTTLSKTDLLCHNYATGSVTATVTGGKPPYRFHWSNGIVEGPTMASTSSIAGLAAGSYAVTILDANDCEIISSVVLTQPDRIVTTIDSDVICLDHLGSGSVSASGGSGTYYYTWYIKDPGTTGLVAGDLIDAGTSEVKISGWDKNEGYADLYVRVEDGNDCPVLDSVRIYFKPCFDLAIRKRVEAPLKQHYPGDVVYFTVEVFNQGSVDALNVKIIDIPDDEMSFSAASNLASVTGNPNDWVLDSGGFISTLIPRINSKEKAIVRIALKINEHTTRKNMINYVRIIDYDGEIVFGTDIRIKNKPKDEDDLSDSTDPNDFLSEVDDEICDSENIAGECTRDDNPDDEDQLDFAVVSICPGGGAFIDQEVCLTSIMRTTGIPLHTPAIYDLLDPEGNGNGVLDNDNGNKIVSLHNSLLESMSGINPITGKIVFGTGTGGASNGQLQPNGNLQVNANQEIKIYARLVALDECLSISVLTYHFTSQPEIVNQPRDVTALIDEENVCFTASVQNPSGIPYTLQWQESIKGTFVDLPGANSEKLCIDTAKVDYDHRIFRLMTYSTEDLNRTCVNTSGSVYLDVGGEPTLACNDLVQISLDVNCTALITPEMINKGAYNSSRFYIKIVDKHGNVVPNPVTGEYIGQLLTVYVIDRISGNSCWGMVTIEDKLPPVIECPLDYTVSCANIAFVPPFPVFRDGCDANATIELISSTLTEYECGRQDDIIAKKVFTFVAKDRFGNASSPCYVTVYFTRGNVHNIQWPDNVNLSCRVAPGYPVWDVNRNDYPDVSETGVPKVDGLNLAVYQDGKLLSNTLCHVNVTYVDEQVALCGNSFKVIRTWTLLDWCTREVKNHSQFIVVMDNEAPQLDCPKGQSIKIFTDAHSCTGTLLVPAPKVISDCNDTHWSIAYSVSSNNVSLPEDQIYITDNVVFNGRDYYIVDLPQGKTWIRYSVVDACDNLAYCYVEVEVIDNIKPVPVCDKHTVVTLNESGNGRLFAQSIDDGSHDNCSKVTFAIRRMKNNCGVPSDADWTATYLGNKYYSYVDFCCLDLNSNLQQVELLVIDEVGNMNTCMTWVEIQNKILPILTCPHDITLDCESPYTPTDLNSFATFSSGCPLYFLDFEDVIDDLKCGEKNIKRNWRVRQKADGKTVVSCVQRILIRNLSPFDLNSVIFPPNVTLVNQCKGVSAFLPDNPATGGYPTWTSIGCSQVAASYRDEVYEVVPDACFKILRYWTVIDWCTHDLTDESTVRNHIQVIKVVDTEKPKINCQDLRFEITEGCSKLVTLIGESEDGCTPADKMRYSHSLNGEPFIQSGIFNRNLTPGEHKLTWIAEDRCGNIDTCSQKIIIVDGKKPSPYCITVLSTVLMPTSLKIDLWAKDFDHGATDNCSQQLRFTFGPNPPVSFARKHYYKNVNGVSVEATEGEYLSGRAELWDPALHSSSRMFNCEDVGLNELDIYVWDDAGNSDFCSVKVIIQDNSGLCAFSRSVIAEGTVIAVNGMPMSNVDTYITNVLNNEAAGVTTDSAGFYLYNKMLNNVPYKVEPVKSDDYLNGLTTLDLVLIQRHILGVELISDPKLLLAADVNQDGKVSASDLSVIRKLILGISTTLPNNRSWIFVANDGMISDNPWDWLQNATFTALNNTTFTNDFTGIKLGDINMSAFLSGNGQFVTSRSQIIPLIINKREVKAGKEESLSVSIKDIDAITSLQLSIELKPGTHFVKMIPGLLDIKQEHYNLINRDGRQILNISWNQSERLDIPSNGILFDLVIQTDSDMKTDEILQMTNTIPAELSDQLLRTYPVKLRYKDIHHDANVGLIVYQNVPNPFIQSTTVRYHVKAAGKVDARVTDLDGRLIYSYEQEAKSGYNELVLNKNIFNHKSGMYLLTISTSLESKTIKMILTEY